MDADERVRRYILRQFIADNPACHLANCNDASVRDAEANFALFYDTGVDGVVFTAILECPHETRGYEYGELGDLPDILAELEVSDQT